MTWTSAQRDAIYILDRHVCVDAGAGSGKTSVLIERMLNLLETHRASLDEIVAITFTDKAAAEMKARLRRECRRRAPADDPAQQTFWRGIERRTDSARISTIHSFCTGLIRENALALGLDPDFTVLMEAENHLLRTEVVTQTILELLDAGDANARRAATELGIARLAATVQKLLRHRAGVAELRHTLPMHNPPALLEWWNATLARERAKTLLALRDNADLLDAAQRLHALAGYCSDAADGREVLRSTLANCLDRIRDANDAQEIEELLTAIFSLNARSGSKKTWECETARNEVKTLFDSIKDALDRLRAKIPDPALEQLAAETACDVYAVFEKALEALDNAKSLRLARDFDDLILDAVSALEKRPDLRARVAKSIRYLLIDEFQDTDHRQLGMALMLAEADGGPELFIVGDAKQSIYYFRGAEVEVFSKAKDWAGYTVRLDTNFRSTPGVMTFIDAFFRDAGLLSAVEPSYHGMLTSRDATRGPCVEFLAPETVEDAKVEDYRRAEAELIAARIAQLCSPEQGSQVYDPRLDAPRDAHFGDIAILLRSMSDVYIYEQALRAAAIPYTVVAGRGFFERQEVTDVRNLLAALVDPWDEMALLAYLRSPIAALPDDDLVRLCDHGPLTRSMQTGALPKGLAYPERVHEAAALLEHLRARTEMPLAAFMRYLLDCTGYEALLLGQYLGAQKAANVRKLADMADGFARGETACLSAFLRYLDDVASEALPEGEAGLGLDDARTVTIMTIHKAKGLEFPIVFVPDTGRQTHHANTDAAVFHADLGLAVRLTAPNGESYNPLICDAIKDRHRAQEEAEQARILYVAMTRARDLLILSGSPAPAKNSWLAAMDAALGVLQMADGERCERDGWALTVYRTANSWIKGTEQPGQAHTPLTAESMTRAAPVAVSLQNRRRFSVTETAAAIGSQAPHTAGSHAPAEKHAIDGALRGEIVHRYLEQWRFDEYSESLANAVLLESGLPAAVQAPMRDTLRDLSARLAAHPLGTAIGADSFARRELPFTLRLDDALLEGQIDLVLSNGTLIDYKTGVPTPALHERYAWQIRLYAAAIAALDGAAPPNAYLFFVDAGEAVSVDVTAPVIESALRHARAAIQTIRTQAVPPLLDAPYRIGIG